MANYPASLDSISNPTGATNQNDAGFLHSVQHGTANDILEALEAKLGITDSPASNAPLANRALVSLANGKSGWGQIITAALATGAATALGYVTVPTQNTSGASPQIIASMTTPGWTGTGIGIAFISAVFGTGVQGAPGQLAYQLDTGGNLTMLGPWNHPVAGQVLPVMAWIPIVGAAAGNHTHNIYATFSNGGAWNLYSGYFGIMELRK